MDEDIYSAVRQTITKVMTEVRREALNQEYDRQAVQSLLKATERRLLIAVEVVGIE